MKNAASHQLEVITNATASLGKGLKKSINSHKKDVKTFTSSVNELMDVSSVLKTIHKVAHPEEHAQRKTSVVHTPIDWSKYPPSAFRKFSEEHSATIREEVEEEIERDENSEERSEATRLGNISNGLTENNVIVKIRTEQLDAIHGWRSRARKAYIQEHTKSEDHHQIVESEIHTNKKRTTSVVSYPSRKSDHEWNEHKHNLAVDHTKTNRNCRFPSPRPSRKENKSCTNINSVKSCNATRKDTG